MRLLLVAIALGAAGCNILFGFDDIQPGTTDAAKPDVLTGPAPNVAAFPGPRKHSTVYLMSYDFVQPVAVTIAADDPQTEIYYTTDGSMPTTSSMHGKTPITGLTINTTTTLSYFGVAGGQSDVVSEQYYVDTTKTTAPGYHITPITLDGGSPIVVATPGQVITGWSANVEVWVQMSCPQCAAQIVYGVDTTDLGCLYDTVRDDPTGPMLFQGFTRTAPFSVTAPTAPGVHIVSVTHSEQTSCANAMAMNALVTRPDLSRIGLIIVK